MNKFLLTLGVLGVAGIIAVVFFLLKPKCKEPMQQVVEIVLLQCTFKLDPIKGRNEICDQLGRGSNCDLDPDKDGEFIQNYIRNTVVKCAKEVLEEQNLCTGSVDGIANGIN